MAAEDDDAAILPALEQLALAAGRAVLDIAANGFVVEAKADASPVTLADRTAEAIILAGLARDFAAIPVVAEERIAEEGRPEDPRPVFFLVDALDGTREFIAGRPDFTVNIALVRDSVPVLGVVHAPARGVLWRGGREGASAARVENGRIADRRAIAAVSPGPTPRIVASASHRTAQTDAFIARLAGARTVAIGSSLKFCLLAAGEADLYPRFGPTMEWDTAAGDAVLRAAGGSTRTLDGAPLAYGKWPGFANPDFIASGVG